MQISGNNHLSADPATAWEAFHDVDVLLAALPGAQAMREVEPGKFEMTVVAGVAAIKGSYDGTATFSQEVEQESFVLSLAGAGGPGTVNADVTVNMSPAADGGTDLAWTADAVVGGPVGGVGQRMLSGVAKRLATQFFNNIDKEIVRKASGAPAAAAAGEGDASAAGAGAGGAGGVDSAGVDSGAAGSGAVAVGGGNAAGGGLGALRTALPTGGGSAGGLAGGAGQGGLVTGMVLGAAIALLGVLVGARARGRAQAN